MASQRSQRRIERLLDEADEAVSRSEWVLVRDRAENVLAFDLENQDALAFLAAANRALGEDQEPPTQKVEPAGSSEPGLPTSFADGRYQVQKFLGEGGNKRVYLAQDGTLDRDVAFALIKTEGLDEVSRTRTSRGAQAMGRLGSHLHIVTVFDLAIIKASRTSLPNSWAAGTSKGRSRMQTITGSPGTGPNDRETGLRRPGVRPLQGDSFTATS